MGRSQRPARQHWNKNDNALHGCTTGEGYLIGAHNLVSERKVIPDNSLMVGSPGKVVTPSDAKIAAMHTYAPHYVQILARDVDELLAV
jgi:carbonic anhydrase/acetyltransferase-like protein (isoleucine patch superfamily)